MSVHRNTWTFDGREEQVHRSLPYCSKTEAFVREDRFAKYRRTLW